MDARGPVIPSLALLLALLAVPAAGQGVATGAIRGQVTSEQGGLPGVVVTASSPQLQGKRVATTTATGDYLLAQLPPGEYVLAFELQGFQTARHSLRLGAAQTLPFDVRMQVASGAEITVAAVAEEIPVTPAIATNLTYDLVDKLPLDRTVNSIISLAPQVNNTGPGGNITIAGAMSYESLYLINGVVVNENVRGQSLPLFIEDAVQETTVTTGAISAEFGRFAGGVVNTITKSGGNKFSGSFRTSFTNDDWRAVTPFGETKIDDLVPTYEGTLGGPVLKDRLWFFLAGRARNSVESRTTGFTAINYPFGDDEKRLEGKLTFSPASNHTLRASYGRIQRDQTNNTFLTVLDERSFDDRSLPQDLLSLNYSGTITNNLFVEAQFSNRHFTFESSGADSRDLIEGTVVTDRQRGSARYWSPTFCGVCTPEKRDNRDILVKGTYFWSGGSGSHELVFGVDSFDDQRRSDNHQSGSDYVVHGTTAILRGTAVYPVFNSNDTTIIQYWPIYEESSGTHFRTHSAFLNDTWRLNRYLSLNLGVRYDKNDGEDSQGSKVADDSALSPRLALNLDLKGDSRWIVNFGYGQYVTALANTIGDSASAGGVPANLQWFYRGPAINTDPNAPTSSLVSTADALRTVFSWFQANGGTSMAPIFANIPGLNTRIDGSLRSPNAVEWTLGLSGRIGQRLQFRADAVSRRFRDFYQNRVDTTTGSATTPLGQRLDMRVIENTNDVKRRYHALNLQLGYRLHDRLNVGGHWSLSRAWGDFNGETAGSGPVTFTGNQFPEYKEKRWNNPEGLLAIDQRHKVRLWASWDAPVPKGIGRVNLSLLGSYDSGRPYGAVGLVDPRPYVTNPGYATPPSSVDYYFTDRDAFQTEGAKSVDFSLDWRFPISALGSTELFLELHLLNAFNGQALIDANRINTTVLTRSNSSSYQRFNPFTEAPVRGVHWDLGPEFGKATSRFAYQTPRTFRFASGLRF